MPRPVKPEPPALCPVAASRAVNRRPIETCVSVAVQDRDHGEVVRANATKEGARRQETQEDDLAGGVGQARGIWRRQQKERSEWPSPGGFRAAGGAGMASTSRQDGNLEEADSGNGRQWQCKIPHREFLTKARCEPARSRVEAGEAQAAWCGRGEAWCMTESMQSGWTPLARWTGCGGERRVVDSWCSARELEIASRQYLEDNALAQRWQRPRPSRLALHLSRCRRPSFCKTGREDSSVGFSGKIGRRRCRGWGRDLGRHCRSGGEGGQFGRHIVIKIWFQ